MLKTKQLILSILLLLVCSCRFEEKHELLVIKKIIKNNCQSSISLLDAMGQVDTVSSELKFIHSKGYKLSSYEYDSVIDYLPQLIKRKYPIDESAVQKSVKLMSQFYESKDSSKFYYSILFLHSALEPLVYQIKREYQDVILAKYRYDLQECCPSIRRRDVLF